MSHLIRPQGEGLTAAMCSFHHSHNDTHTILVYDTHMYITDMWHEYLHMYTTTHLSYPPLTHTTTHLSYPPSHTHTYIYIYTYTKYIYYMYTHTHTHTHIYMAYAWSTFWGVGIDQWLEHQTCDSKVTGPNPCRSGRIILFSRINFLCWLLLQYPFHPCSM